MGRFNNRTNPRGRGGGRGGRFTSKKENNKKKNKLQDHYFYVGSNKQASDFETTYEFLVNYIKRTYTRGNDIAEALRKMENPHTDTWKPSLRISLSTDTDENKREGQQYKLDYKAEFDEYMKRKRTFKENSYKAYAEIWA